MLLPKQIRARIAHVGWPSAHAASFVCAPSYAFTPGNGISFSFGTSTVPFSKSSAVGRNR